MPEFIFKIFKKDGSIYKYAFRAHDKLAAFAHMKEQYPDGNYEKIDITEENV